MTIEDRLEKVVQQLNMKQYPITDGEYETGFNDGLYEAVRYLELILELADIKEE